MIRTLLFAFSFFTLSILSAQLVDDFTDGDFTLNPKWNGDTANFEVDLAQKLHLLAPAVADTSYLSTPSSIINNTTWEFYVEMNFGTSSSNYAKVYLTSDNSDLKSSLNGYFVKIGNTTDEVSLYRQDGWTETEIIDGVDGLVNTTPAIAHIRVTRDGLGNWTLEADSTGGTTYALQGSVNDATYTSTAHFGVLCNYTSTRSDKFYFDDFNITAVGDTSAPFVVNVIPISNNQLDVQFNEVLDVVSAQNISNYSVDLGIGNPSTANIDALDSSLVHLTFTNAFTNNQSYNLTVTNVADTAGNTIATQIFPFTFSFFATANTYDVVINEIFADPTPQVGLPNAEFVELYNTTTNAFDLSNWQFVNTTTVKTLPNFVLLPNDYVILCNTSDTALYAPYGNVIGISSFTALSNGGDSLTLLDNNGKLIDKVAYDISWYNDAVKDDGGWTLELINPIAPCKSGSGNWTSSVDPNGGTPGTQNSVWDTTPDTQSPIITSLTINSLTEIKIDFSESMDSTSLANASYTINNGIAVTNVTLNNAFTSVILTLTPVLDSTILYTLQITGANDCSGNILNPNSINFAIGVSPQKFDLIITELFPDPEPFVGIPEYEFIEIYNNSNKVIQVNGLKVADFSSNSSIQQTDFILPGEYVIVCDDNNEPFFTGFGKVLTVSSMPSLNNSTDVISLLDANNNMIHFVEYFDTWYNDEVKKDGGWTLEMIDPNNPCAGAENWSASQSPIGGTPAAQNSIYANNPDVTPPYLTEVIAINDSTVWVTFNENLLSNDLMISNYNINNNVNVIGLNVLSSNQIELSVFPKLQVKIIYTLTVTGTNDCVGNTIGANNTKNFALPENTNEGDIVINEVLFDPYPGSDDFVEIYNNSDKYINLQNWNLANFTNDTISSLKAISTNPLILEPFEFMLLTIDTYDIKVNYPNAVSESFQKMSEFPSYNNGEGQVYLIASDNRIIDHFAYNEDMHFPLLNSTEGVSLERIDYDRPTNDKTNWHSAAESVGFATPGYENSQHKKGEGDSEVSVEPEIFSPDNDGYNDVMNINYDFGEPGYVANIIIYDDRGRLIKNLVLNELLATKGTFSWDGITETNEKAPIGIYILYFEAFDLSGNIKKYKQTFVLGGNL
ncbi:MAG: hypothetical protein Kow0079_08340 [Vicingaceae bacterium]